MEDSLAFLFCVRAILKHILFKDKCMPCQEVDVFFISTSFYNPNVAYVGNFENIDLIDLVNLRNFLIFIDLVLESKMLIYTTPFHPNREIMSLL